MSWDVTCQNITKSMAVEYLFKDDGGSINYPKLVHPAGVEPAMCVSKRIKSPLVSATYLRMQKRSL